MKNDLIGNSFHKCKQTAVVLFGGHLVEHASDETHIQTRVRD